MEGWIEEVENTGTADVVGALRVCAEQLGCVSSWSYLWARARENAAGDSVAAVDEMRADVRRLLALLFGEPEGEGAVKLTIGGIPLPEAERLMAKTRVFPASGDKPAVIIEYCDHEGAEEGWVSVDLGGHRHIYLCPHCAGLMRWEAIKALVKESGTVHSGFSAAAHAMGGPAGE